MLEGRDDRRNSTASPIQLYIGVSQRADETVSFISAEGESAAGRSEGGDGTPSANLGKVIGIAAGTLALIVYVVGMLIAQNNISNAVENAQTAVETAADYLETQITNVEENIANKVESVGERVGRVESAVDSIRDAVNQWSGR